MFYDLDDAKMISLFLVFCPEACLVCIFRAGCLTTFLPFFSPPAKKKLAFPE